MAEGSIALEGLSELKRNLEKAKKAVQEATMAGLTEAGMEIIADAQDNLRQNSSVVTGLLRQSGHTIRKGLEVLVGFFDTTNRNSGYALYVEYGRRAGKMPPPDQLAAWAYKKYHLKDWRVANAMGWALARRIAQKGTDPHPFFNPAVKKQQARIEKYIRDSVNKATR